MTDFVAFSSVGLHSGRRTNLRLERRAGPLSFEIAGTSVMLDELELARADHGVAVRHKKGGPELDLVEHLFAAFAGLSIRSGIVVSVSGPEIPLLDGGASELTRALALLAPPRDAPRLVVAERGEVVVGESTYLFEPASELAIEVEIDFPRAGIGRQRARFDGSVGQFVREIAPARTFGFRSDADALRARGRAHKVDLASVIVIEESGRVLGPAAPPGENELARHKLLDLMGDLYFYGGPPLGRIFASRPGHSRSHAAVREALSLGLVRRTREPGTPNERERNKGTKNKEQ